MLLNTLGILVLVAWLSVFYGISTSPTRNAPRGRSSLALLGSILLAIVAAFS